MTGSRRRGALRCAVGGAALVALAAAATAKEYHATFQAWSTYTDEVGGEKVCYMASAPVSAEGAYTRRGDMFVQVTHWPDQKGVVRVIAGYPYRENSTVTVTVGEESFTLFTAGSDAWVADPDEERRLVEAMKRGAWLVVVGTSQRGTFTTDTYSLMGFTAAYDDIGKRCGEG